MRAAEICEKSLINSKLADIFFSEYYSTQVTAQILLVEDETDLLESIVAFLSGQWQVHPAANLADAEKILTQHPIDLIVLDINLPDGSGFQFCTKLRQQEKHKKTPVVFLTGNFDVSDRVMGFTLGADDYVTKPFHLAELKARIEAHLRRSQQLKNSPPSIDAGDLTLDINHQKVTLKTDGQKKPIKLTSLEFRILLVLAQTPGHIFSRDQIILSVWGNDSSITSRVIDTHVSNLRKKISASTYTIHSVHGRGYQFAPKNSER